MKSLKHDCVDAAVSQVKRLLSDVLCYLCLLLLKMDIKDREERGEREAASHAGERRSRQSGLPE